MPHLALHVAVFFWAATALFAKLIPLPAEWIIYLRSLPALLVLSLSLLWLRQPIPIRKDIWFAGFIMGCLAALHWVTFYQSIQLSTVAVGLLTLYTYPLFTAIAEPLLHHHRPDLRTLLTASLGLLGVAIMGSETISGQLNWSAIGAGLLSSLAFALRNLFCKYRAARIPALQQMWFQVAVTLLVLAIYFGPEPFSAPSMIDWQLLVLLGVVFVAFPHTLFLYSLKHINATRASLMSLVQPVYAIAMAYFILGEIPSTPQLLGGGVILLAAGLAIISKGQQQQ